jgi:S-DNA-T family DNA segregation ATPase FtsK/SpoIIIE
MDTTGVQDDIQIGVKAVQETLASFKIDARVTDVKRGPVITRYEVQPAPGVRVASIANLDRDMARSLSALAVRIEAPVPGKDVVGIEVPNKKVHLVRLRDVLERHDFLSTQSKLSFVLGKDIAGQPKWADLTKMPHMLIAGATNSGKSVCLNSIIASILVRATPEEVKFSLIDPKRVELTLYRDIPHLYHPVVVEPKDAVRALRGAISEMDKRYKRFAERGVRNIASYNAKLEEGEAPLPYLVIVIDELADLMMTAAAEFEKLICRLAQLARATGIHLIVATQRPSVNVITGVIKANIPSRVAFAVASQVDSRTILDSVGAERLIGSGDMLFDANNGGKAVRIQGAFLSEEEVNRVVDVVKAHYGDDEPLDYGLDLDEVDDDGVLDEGGNSRSDEKRDDLYDEILEFVQRNTEMSASLIQRKFEIGYPRAGRIVDQLERDGVLSPADGSKPRKVIGTGRQS